MALERPQVFGFLPLDEEIVWCAVDGTGWAVILAMADCAERERPLDHKAEGSFGNQIHACIAFFWAAAEPRSLPTHYFLFALVVRAVLLALRAAAVAALSALRATPNWALTLF